MEEQTFSAVYGPDEQAKLAKLLDIKSEPWGQQAIHNNLPLLADVEVIIASWGVPVMDKAFLDAAPNLRAVFYGAGSVRSFTTPAFWKRNISLSSAYAVNAVPVSEYTLGVILLSLKRFWASAHSVKNETNAWGNHLRQIPGAYHSTVGLVSCGMIARRVIQLLKAFDVQCLVYDPFLSEADAARLGVKRCSLADVFRLSDVVSVHTPLLPETREFITGQLISSMKKDATFINTAKGGLVRESEMTDVLHERSDLSAVLDVCESEPPAAGSRLLQLPNVILTPHISGSQGKECQRLGHCMTDELTRYLAGEPLQWLITEEFAARSA